MSSDPQPPSWRRLTSCLLAVLCLFANCVAGQENSPRAAFEKYVLALNVGDVEGALDFYLDDPRFSWIEDGALRYRSKSDVRSALTELERYGTVNTETSNTEITVLSKDHALLTTDFKTTIGDGDFSFSGMMSMTLERNATGGWQLIKGHSSTTRDDR